MPVLGVPGPEAALDRASCRVVLPSCLVSGKGAGLADGPECPLPASLPGHGAGARERWISPRMHLRGWFRV